MKPFSPEPEPVPGPGTLIAYVDGTLDSRSRGQVESWLAVHPQMAAELDEHRAVVDAARAAPLPEPTEAAWALTLARIEAALPAARTRVPVRWRATRILARAAAAAATVLLVTSPGEPVPSSLPERLTAAAVAPLEVATADEVEILSIDAGDLKGLLVGHPPLREPLVLAVAGEVELHHAEAGQTSWVPAMTEGEGTTPMIVMPVRNGPEDKP